MFSNVLVGVDGRQGGRDAIALARQLTVAGAKLTLVHIYKPFLGRGAADVSALESTEGHRLLEREREHASVEAQLVVRGELPVGRGLHELAEELCADVIVVGSTRHSLLGRVLIGDDCRASLDGASCGVAVAPGGYAGISHRMQRVGVGYDGSLESEHALSVAHELADLHGGSITALYVVTPQDVRKQGPAPSDWSRAIDKLIDRQTENLARLEGVHGDVTYGEPSEELAQFGKHLDLLIVGSRGFGPIGRLFHGSVSRYLLGHAACPLLVMPRESASRIGPSGEVRMAGSARGSTISK